MARHIAQRFDNELIPECPTDGKCDILATMTSLDKNSSDLLQHLMYLPSDERGTDLQTIQEIFEKRKFPYNYLEKDGDFQGFELNADDLKSALSLLHSKKLIEIFQLNIQSFKHVHVKCPKCCLAALDKPDLADYAVRLAHNLARHVEETGIAHELETSVLFLTTHDALKVKKWPHRSIETSIIFLLNMSLNFETEKDSMTQEIDQYFQGLSSEEREGFGGELAAFKITKHFHNEISSLVSSDDTDDEQQRISKTWEIRTGKKKVIKRRSFANWIIEKVMEYPNCNALLQAAHIALARLKMHSRLAKPSDQILKWVESYRGKACEQILLYCILATWDNPTNDEEKEEYWDDKLYRVFLQEFTKRLKDCKKTDAYGLRNWWEALATLLIYKCRPLTIRVMRTPLGIEFFEAASAWCCWTWEEKYQDRPKWIRDRVHNTTIQILRIPKLVLSDKEPHYGEQYENVEYFLNMKEFAQFCASLIVNTDICMDPEKYGTGSWIANYYHIFRRVFYTNVDARTFVKNVLDFGIMDKIKLLAAEVQTQVLFEKERVEAIYNLFLTVVILYNRLLVPDPIVVPELEMDEATKAEFAKSDGTRAESLKKDCDKTIVSKKEEFVDFGGNNIRKMQSVLVILAKDLEAALRHPKMNHHFFSKYKYASYREECGYHRSILTFFTTKYEKFSSCGSTKEQEFGPQKAKTEPGSAQELQDEFYNLVKMVTKISQEIKKTVQDAEYKAKEDDFRFFQSLNPKVLFNQKDPDSDADVNAEWLRLSS